jgi:hypothetical protein
VRESEREREREREFLTVCCLVSSARIDKRLVFLFSSLQLGVVRSLCRRLLFEFENYGEGERRKTLSNFRGILRHR